MDRLQQEQDSKFRLCILAAKRAKQLVNGAKKKLDIKAENFLTVAIEEIRNEVINFHVLNEEEEKRLSEQALFNEEAVELLDDESPEFSFSRIASGENEEEKEDVPDLDVNNAAVDDDEDEDDDDTEFLLEGGDDDEELDDF